MIMIMKTLLKSTMKIIHDRFPYRFTENGVLENGKPDYRIQKFSMNTKRYSDMYLLDNSMQLGIALEDIEYCKWLDPAGVPCYTKNRVTSPYSS